MHRGVNEFISWISQNPDFTGLVLEPAATTADLVSVEEAIASPLPGDLRFVLGRFNGGVFPSGHMLAAGAHAVHGIQTFLGQLSARMGRSPDDPEVLLPFFASDDGGVLAFDRSAGPISDTWPIVDYYVDSGDLRLVHRTFDGWCRLRVAEWMADDFEAEFDLKKYLSSGQRHADIEVE